MTEVEYLESRMREDRAECARLRKKEQNDKVAAELRAIFESLVDQGFTEEQAFEILKMMVNKAWENG